MRDPDSSPSPACWSDPAVLLATCGGVGRVGFAPGTFGSLVGIPVSLATGWLATVGSARLGSGRLASGVEAALVAAVCLIAVPICSRAVRRLGRGDDPGAIVLDEAAALPLLAVVWLLGLAQSWLVLWLIPLALLAVPWAGRTWPVLVVGFLLFRLFDIAKPFPCRRLESLPDGLGIMADDWGAAAWAAAGLAIARGQGWV